MNNPGVTDLIHACHGRVLASGELRIILSHRIKEAESEPVDRQDCQGIPREKKTLLIGPACI
jgi:hypothetical protein